MAETAAEFVPQRHTLPTLRKAVSGCRGCGLWKEATQAVFGEGRAKAQLMLVGEQPGDQEDRRGEPFVGPAGRVLDQALEEAGVDRSQAYVTNAVKHFKWHSVGGGKRRLHDKPSVGEIKACRPWLEAEIDAVEPEAVLALGATAARSLFGPTVRVTKDRGRLLESDLAPIGAVTIHPAAVVRLRDPEERREALEELAADIELVAAALD
jgi:DNA polymerase